MAWNRQTQHEPSQSALTVELSPPDFSVHAEKRDQYGELPFTNLPGAGAAIYYIIPNKLESKMYHGLFEVHQQLQATWPSFVSRMDKA